MGSGAFEVSGGTDVPGSDEVSGSSEVPGVVEVVSGPSALSVPSVSPNREVSGGIASDVCSGVAGGSVSKEVISVVPSPLVSVLLHPTIHADEVKSMIITSKNAAALLILNIMVIQLSFPGLY